MADQAEYGLHGNTVLTTVGGLQRFGIDLRGVSPKCLVKYDHKNQVIKLGSGSLGWMKIEGEGKYRLIHQCAVNYPGGDITKAQRRIVFSTLDKIPTSDDGETISWDNIGDEPSLLTPGFHIREHYDAIIEENREKVSKITRDLCRY